MDPEGSEPTGGVHAAKPSRKAGRRPKLGNEHSPPSLTKADVIRHLIELAQREAFSEITVARLARELGVASSLIHYFLGNRDDMLILVFNHALRELAEGAPPLTGSWRADIDALLRQAHRTLMKWRGITTHLAAQNRYRIFQDVAPGEIDFGLVFFDRVGRVFRAAGFSAEDSALAYHLLMLFLTSVARAHMFRQEPAAQRDFITNHVGKFSATDYPGATFVVPSFTNLDTETTFERGMVLLLDGFEGWLKK